MSYKKMKRYIAAVLCIFLFLLSFSVTSFAAYENTYKNTGDGAKDIIGVAKTQLGNTNGNKYVAGPWCCGFVVWCARQAGIGSSVIPETASCSAMYDMLNPKLITKSQSKGSSYVPIPGDLAFFKNLDHIGIVVSVSSTSFTLIEGNCSNRVKEMTYSMKSSEIIAFASPDYTSKGTTGLVYKVKTTTNIRSGASTGSSIVGRAETGSSVYVDCITPDNWGAVSYNGKTAWMCLDWSTFTSGVFVSDNIINLRSTPSLTGTIIDTIPANSSLAVEKIDAENKNWGYISYLGKTGWICLSEGTDREAEVNWLVVDVSQHNAPSEIDWNKLKKSGVQAAIIRIGGRYVKGKALYDDSAFEQHYKGAKEAGLHVGVYFFSYAMSAPQAVEEAQMTISLLQKYKCELDMPVFIDMEDYGDSSYVDHQHADAGKSVCTAVADAFCGEIEAAGYYAGVYSSKSFVEYLLDVSVFNNRAVWIAHYGVTQCGYSGNYDMWQFTPCGRISGAEKDIDLSQCYTDFPALISKLNNTDFGDHKPGDWETVTAATCSLAGERRKKCKDCGIELISETVPYAAHSPGSVNVYLVDYSLQAGSVVTDDKIKLFHTEAEPNFDLLYLSTWKTQGGTKLTYCKNCKKVLTAEYSYPGCAHSKTSVNTTASTCTAEGRADTVCQDCGKTISSKLLTTAYHKSGAKQYSSASCISSGTCTVNCSVCGVKISKCYVDKTQHKPGVWTAVKKVTCVSDGEYSTKCKVCSQTLSKIITHPTFGDINTDGRVDTADARLALRASVKLDELSELAYAAGDIDNSGSVEAVDARFMLRIAVDLENQHDLCLKYYGVELEQG